MENVFFFFTFTNVCSLTLDRIKWSTSFTNIFFPDFVITLGIKILSPIRSTLMDSIYMNENLKKSTTCRLSSPNLIYDMDIFGNLSSKERSIIEYNSSSNNVSSSISISKYLGMFNPYSLASLNILTGD
ncbi:hypothetical protein pCPXV0099 [Cowpox virus]|uniref:Uncharacterized 14.5 kDa protein n=8 Tax=Orthopoxvirus TaxID=10242 RepID=YVAH_VACCC|nr:RecName: Full=Uncharacterized 14.5 kDa protein [Vaccinia virus Copenhagen]AAF34016.1 unknown [Vaccinia virus Tian Tan]AAW23568.1 hypothetical protein m8179L [Vaccinia virus]ABZ80092.1 unknown [synthetic Vaccinia virus]SNB48598.1 hypothetical protein pCPXV0099 [Cowpox virus]BBD06224.1 putative A ORF H [BAC cloning vector pLC16m8.8S-BAC]